METAFGVVILAGLGLLAFIFWPEIEAYFKKEIPAVEEEIATVKADIEKVLPKKA